MAMLMSSNTELAPSVASIWVVYDASKISVWCSKTDCPLLGREVTYDVVKEEESDDGELESIIKTGLSEEESNSGDYNDRVMRLSSAKIKHND